MGESDKRINDWFVFCNIDILPEFSSNQSLNGEWDVDVIVNNKVLYSDTFTYTTSNNEKIQPHSHIDTINSYTHHDNFNSNQILDMFELNSNASDLYENNKYEEEIAVLDQMLKSLPEKDIPYNSLEAFSTTQPSEIWGKKGIALFLLGRYAESEAAFDQMIDTSGENDYRSWLNKGEALFAQGEFEKSYNAFTFAKDKCVGPFSDEPIESIIEVTKNKINSVNHGSDSLLSSQDWTELGNVSLVNEFALHDLSYIRIGFYCFQKAVKIDPNNMNAWWGLTKTGNYTDSIEAYSEIIRIDPQNVEAYREMGNLMCSEARNIHDDELYEKAKSASSTAIELDNTGSYSLCNCESYRKGIQYCHSW